MSGGFAFADACDAMGIPLEEAQRWAEKRLLKGDATAYQLRAVGQRALAKALERLEAIVDEGPRYSETLYSETGKPTSSRTPISTDLDAAKTLAKLAMDTLKSSGASAPALPEGRGGKLSVQLDLWDNPGNWVLKKPS